MALNLVNKIKNLKNLNPELPAIQFAKKAAKYISLGSMGLFFGAYLYFAKLGAAALKGFIIGASIGGTGGAIGGAILGAQVGAAIGTVVIPIPFVGTFVGGVIGGGVGLVAGGFLGAALMGIAGGLIAVGLESGSVALGASGVGAGIGTTVGVYVGATAGTAVGVTITTGFISFAVAACAATLIGCVLVPIATVSAPIIVATSTAIGAAVGGAIGFVIGGVGGYIIGKYILDPTWSYIKGTPNAVGSTISGGLAGFGHMITGLASAAWGGAINLGGWLLNGVVNIGSSLLGYLTGGAGALAGQIAGISVGVGIASAATLAVVSSGVLTPGKFATTQTDKSQNIIPPPGSAYVTVTKTANPSTLQNSDLPKTINFEVVVSTKSVKIINVTCEDLTTLVKSGGSTTPLTVAPAPVCPPTIDANSQIKFDFSTQAENTPDFQNASIVNVFNIYYDIEQLALGSCGTGSGFSNLLPNPIPPSAGAVSPTSFSTLNSGQIVPAAVYGAQKSGVACELLVGIDFVEDNWNDQKSFINGGPISQVYPVENAGICAAYNGTWIQGSGCQINALQDVAYYADNIIKDKMAYFMGLGWRPPANFEEMVGAMSHYNGGGNHNCNNIVSVPYSGPCPAPYYGNDDAYAMTHFDSPHQTMYIFYCNDGVFCNPPYSNTRDGAATAAKEYYLKGAGP